VRHRFWISMLVAWFCSSLLAQSSKEIMARVQSLTPEQIPQLLTEANSGNVASQLILGIAYRFGRGVDRNLPEAANWLTKASDGGSASAANDLGVMYQDGTGVPQSDDRAASLFAKAAQLRDAGAQANLGFMYMQGRGVPKDVAKAFEWTWKSAQQGYAAGETNLGVMYMRGEGTKADTSRAIEMFSKASDQGYVPAQGLLGFAYLAAETPEGDALALRWLSAAASHGDRNAVNFLPTLKNGKAKIEAPEDLTTLRRRGEQGDPEAQGTLGTLYMLAKQPVLAYFWLSLLAENKDKNARENEKSAQKMVKLMPKANMINAEELAAARVRVEQWHLAHASH